jgi:hypothetical protein
MGYYYSIYHFVDRSPRTKISILLLPVVAHGVYDSLAMSGMVNDTVGGFAFLILIYFSPQGYIIYDRFLALWLQRQFY